MANFEEWQVQRSVDRVWIEKISEGIRDIVILEQSTIVL
jgi:hypothetical protein